MDLNRFIKDRNKDYRLAQQIVKAATLIDIVDLAQSIQSENTKLLECMECRCASGIDTIKEMIKPPFKCPRCKLLEERKNSE